MLRCGQNEIKMRSARGSLYEILRKSGAYFKLRCGQRRIGIRSAHGSYIESQFLNTESGPFALGDAIKKWWFEKVEKWDARQKLLS